MTMDPVAAKSSFLCMYMSNHKDTLASYVIYYGKVANTKITNTEMTGIDSQVHIRFRASRHSFTSLVRPRRVWTSVTKPHPQLMGRYPSGLNSSLRCLGMKMSNPVCY